MAEQQFLFQYLKDLPRYATEKPFIYESNLSYDKPPVSNVEKEIRSVKLTNVRGNIGSFSCDEHGFMYMNHKTSVTFDGDKTQESLEYIEETMSLLQEIFNTNHVISYDIRRRDSNQDRKDVQEIQENAFEKPREPAPPVYAVHIGELETLSFNSHFLNSVKDHTLHGGFHRAKRHLTDEEIEKFINSGKYRIRIVNTWRPIKKINSSPLAVCDFNTLSMDDLVETDLVSEDYLGETYSLKYNPTHEFYWLRNQKPEELCVFVVFDSLNNSTGKITACAHTAFENPYAPSNAPARQSIEVRSLVLTLL
ncbi:hypothetical protein PITC_020750 [Penicillium italicum]|uniref:Methyltransferase n=1 Tax=Penicillium italicum TaxID=40296 RepID=A0A0A2KTL5_PENIT|nr:hypothetical protein PITC_020750 [Penicillium italicum]